ncbi:uncharacterized [Tachysurus ichikawai]
MSKSYRPEADKNQRAQSKCDADQQQWHTRPVRTDGKRVTASLTLTNNRESFAGRVQNPLVSLPAVRADSAQNGDRAPGGDLRAWAALRFTLKKSGQCWPIRALNMEPPECAQHGTSRKGAGPPYDVKMADKLNDKALLMLMH